MEVLILAGGRGPRLSEETGLVPKTNDQTERQTNTLADY